MGSYIEDYSNQVDLVRYIGGSLKKVGGFIHEFPPTKLAFSPLSTRNEVLATSGDALRLWEVDPSTLKTTLLTTFSSPDNVL